MPCSKELKVKIEPLDSPKDESDQVNEHKYRIHLANIGIVDLFLYDDDTLKANIVTQQHDVNRIVKSILTAVFRPIS